jgi:RNA polymerase sigma-70 factor (ECF subfamily)
MTTTSRDPSRLIVLGAGNPPKDREAFDRLVGPYRRELKVHCYKMLGSAHDAEDLLQESFLRAWRGLARFQGRASLRTWLYRITTNACLNALASRKSAQRLLPDTRGPASTQMPEGEPDLEPTWIEPYPDFELEDIADDAAGPAARYEMADSVRIAFVVAIQHLPPRQRAVLLLSDVLGWAPVEVASLLGGSIASVNSALQRARGTLANHYPNDQLAHRPTTDDQQRALLDRYLRAWEHKDLDGFVNLLREDAVYSMPPWSHWYQGRSAIRSFFEAVWVSYGSFRLLPVRANLQPGFAVYTRGPSNSLWRAHSIQLLSVNHGSIISLTKYVPPLGPSLFRTFGLAETLSNTGS